jgi:glycosyltransferase involved in cell wall biosynthesis
MTEVLAISAQAESAPGMRVRARIPARGLKRFGLAVHALPLFTDAESKAFRSSSLASRSRLVLRARRRAAERSTASTADVTWILRQADLLPSTALERRVAAGRRLVYDVDDAVWFDRRDAGGHPLAFLKRSARKAQWLAEHADHVVAGNEVLAEWLSKYTSEMTVVPSLIDPTDAPQHRHEASDRVVIGWIGSQTTSPYLGRAIGAIERAAKVLSGVELSVLVVGGISPPLRGVRCIQQPWSEARERDALRRMDIGIMPLPDNRWTRGKCAYKAIQYMASGIPVVADDVGITRHVVGGGGLVPAGTSEWIDALVGLAEDERERAKLGDAGRRRAAAEFSVKRWAPTLAKLLKGS